MPEPVLPKVRVVVLNWNSAWFTRRCLRALASTEYPDDRLEIVVVDNASVDGSLEQIRHSFPSVRIIANADNLGFAEGCNRAMRDRAGVDFVALVNNDAVPEPGWLQPLVDAVEADPGAGAAAVQLVLEPPFTALDLELTGGSAVIEGVRVGGVEVLDRTLMHGIRSVGHVDWPMTLDHHLDAAARLLLPAAPGARRVEITLTGTGTLVAATEAERTEVVLDGGRATIALAGGEDREERLNGLGTDLSADSEGRDRFYGEPRSVLADAGGDVVPGFCGGGVLLRAEMLDEVGVFDPAFFAYYEDTDLSWRARRAGWHTLAVPESVIRHAFGGSAGNKARGFFFLNYRNWMVTVLRNATPAERRVAMASAWARIKWAVRANVLSAVKHRRRPSVALVSAWARVVVAGLLAWPRVRRSQRSGPVGERRTDHVRSRLQPAPAPRRPSARPGGPLVVYLDVTAALGSASASSHPLAAVARGLGDAEPRIDLVALVATEVPTVTGFRGATPREWARLTGGRDHVLAVVDEQLELERWSPGSVVLRLDGADPAQLRADRVPWDTPGPDARAGEAGSDPRGAESVTVELDPYALQRLGSRLVEQFGTP